LFTICLGIGLSAACGFRIFVPFLVMSFAALHGYLHLSSGFAWIGTWPALWTFLTAAIVEVAAYHIPWLDHALDTIAGPVAVVAGALTMASSITDMDPFMKWTLAIIAGGGAAALTQSTTMLARGVSTVLSGGIGNPAVATAEAVAAAVLSMLAIALPLLAGLVVIGIALFAIRKLMQRMQRKKTAPINK